MDKLVKRYLFLLALPVCHLLLAQDTLRSDTLPVLEVLGGHLDYFQGTNMQTLDTMIRVHNPGANLGDVLQLYSNVFIKQYGPGNLSSTSIRGGTAHQTSVFWNGFNLQNPALGQADCSYFPAILMDEIKIQYGSGGAVFGNSTQAGSVQINNKPFFEKQQALDLQSSYGSFGSKFHAAKISAGNSRFYSTVKLFRQQAKNDFPFVQRSGIQEKIEQQQNADFVQTGLMSELYYKPGKFQQISVRYWKQENERGTGKPSSVPVSNARILNRFDRVSLEWKNVGKVSDLMVRTAYFREHLDYSDERSSVYSNTLFSTLISEIEHSRNISKRVVLNTGILNTLNEVSSSNYSSRKTQNRTAFYSLLKYKSGAEKCYGTVALRKELVNGFRIPLTLNAGGVYKFRKTLGWRTHISRNYRIPTFNDLYYVPNGNPDVLPEDGWSIETGLDKQLKNAEIKLTGFVNQYANMIVWQPGIGLWQPNNVQAKAKGLEASVLVFGHVRKLDWKIRVNANALESKNTTTDFRLIYVPAFSENTTLQLILKNWQCVITQFYVGQRYVSTDNSYFLSAYALFNTSFTYSIPGDKVQGTVGFKMNNVLDTEYTTIVNYPMPGRNYNLFTRIQFAGNVLRKKAPKI